MRVMVVGAGSIGTLISAMLARARVEVRLLCRDGKAAERINSDGISVEGVSGSWQARVKACADPGQAPGCGLILFCVKSYDTRTAAEAVKPALGDGAYVITIQNGMGNVELLQDVLGAERVIGGITSMGATLLGPGRVRHAGKGETVIGRVDGRMPVVMRSIRETLNRAGIETKITREMRGCLWSKLIVNAGINALTAVTRLSNGKLLEFKETRDLLRQAVGEGARLAKRKRIKLMYDDPLARAEAVCEATSANVSSMLQDVLAARRTEVEHINGFIVRQGEELGIPVPVNAVLHNLVKTIEAGYGITVK